MNDCCKRPGNASITQSTKPSISWRVVCLWCGLVIHEQEGALE